MLKLQTYHNRWRQSEVLGLGNCNLRKYNFEYPSTDSRALFFNFLRIHWNVYIPINFRKPLRQEKIQLTAYKFRVILNENRTLYHAFFQVYLTKLDLQETFFYFWMTIDILHICIFRFMTLSHILPNKSYQSKS